MSVFDSDLGYICIHFLGIVHLYVTALKRQNILTNGHIYKKKRITPDRADTSQTWGVISSNSESMTQTTVTANMLVVAGEYVIVIDREPLEPGCI